MQNGILSCSEIIKIDITEPYIDYFYYLQPIIGYCCVIQFVYEPDLNKAEPCLVYSNDNHVKPGLASFDVDQF